MGIFDIFNSEKKSKSKKPLNDKNKKYQKNDIVDFIKDKKIAIFGFGTQGKVHALNLRDSGVNNIVIALRENSKSITKAKKEGFHVAELSKAAEWADIIMMLVPDKVQLEVYAKHIEQYIKEGSYIGFVTTFGDDNTFKYLKPIRSDLNQFQVSTDLNGEKLRKSFKDGNIVGVSYSNNVNNNSDVSQTWVIALAYVLAIGSSSQTINHIANENDPFDFIDNSKKQKMDENFKKQKKNNSDDELPDSKKGPSQVGTGFFVDNKGHIVTNYHVVKASKNNTKIMFNNDEIKVKIIAHDEILDIALLKAKVKNKNYIKFSNASPKKAQNILVAGYPYGKFISDDLKITSGIINSLKGIQNNTSMLQIDATINPGNSGGPIVDKVSGSLVGVATMKLNKDFTKAAFGTESENTNYGIKSSQVKDFLEANNIEISIKSNKLKISELENATVYIFS